MKHSTISHHAIIAANRFGLGAKGDELAQANLDPKGWLLNQLQQATPLSFNPELPSSDHVLQTMFEFKQGNKMGSSTKKQMNSYLKQTLRAFIYDTLNQAIQSPHSFNWRLLDFFSNHFSVSTSNQKMRGLAPTLEREAIAPNLTGNFEDLLLAAIKHPAMLIYLNNEKSFGPNSKIGKRGRGLNENLAREILELHTLGVNGGYVQADVLELAKGISGWSLGNPKRNQIGFKFIAAGHEPGGRSLLGKTYKKGNIEQGEAMLVDLARHPSTAIHLCLKIARHFISDTPPQSLLDAMVKRWQQTQGNILQVMIVMLDAEESWQASAQKYKTPREFVISAFRAVEATAPAEKHLIYSLRTLGQMPFSAGSPAGFSDEKNGWNGASAFMTRIDWAAAFAGKFKRFSPKTLLEQSLSNEVTDSTGLPILRAQSSQEAIALLLMSPEFQWR